MDNSTVVNIRSGGKLTIRYDGPLNRDQIAEMKPALAVLGRTLGVEVVLVLTGQLSDAADRARRMLTDAGVHPELAGEITDAIVSTGSDPVHFARYFIAVGESLREQADVK